MEIDSPIGQRWKVMRDALDERQRRLLVAFHTKFWVEDASVLSQWPRVFRVPPAQRESGK
jgi:hypothetical protein